MGRTAEGFTYALATNGWSLHAKANSADSSLVQKGDGSAFFFVSFLLCIQGCDFRGLKNVKKRKEHVPNLFDIGVNNLLGHMFLHGKGSKSLTKR